jgi:hypothetical protein
VKGFEQNKAGTVGVLFRSAPQHETWGVGVGVIAPFPPVRGQKRDEVFDKRFWRKNDLGELLLKRSRTRTFTTPS